MELSSSSVVITSLMLFVWVSLRISSFVTLCCLIDDTCYPHFMLLAHRVCTRYYPYLMLLAIEPLYLQTLSIGSVCRIFRFYHHRHRQLKFVGAEKFSLVMAVILRYFREFSCTMLP